jgi:hypothetical protein
MGDLNNGNYPVGLEFSNIRIDEDDDNTPILFIYQIVNAGNSQSAIQQRLQTTADTIAGAIAGGSIVLAGPTSGVSLWGLVVAGSIETLNVLYSWLTVNCDGPVAVDAVEISGAKLHGLISQGGRYSETRSYPGLDSAVGCGSNSQYSVSWSVVAKTNSLREFLGWSGFNPSQGIRHIQPPVTSLRAFMRL